MPRKASITALLAVTLLLSGCTGTMPATTDSGTQNCNVESLAFWNANDHHGWESDKLRVGYQLSGSAEILLVASENDTVLGVKHVTSDQAISADGAPLHLDRPLKGEHTLRVLAYGDANGNGQFDPQIDTRCTAETDSLRLNFSTLETQTNSI